MDDRTGASLGYQATGTYQTASIVKVDILATTLWDDAGGADALARQYLRTG